MRLSLVLGFVLGLALLAAAAAPPADAARMGGIVVGKDRAQRALIVADAAGIARTVRVGKAFKLPVGARIALGAKRLNDGTYRSTGARVLGKTKIASVRGVVLRLFGGGYLLATGESVLVIKRPKPIRTTQGRSDDTRPGDEVKVGVTIAKSGELSQKSVQDDSPGSSAASVEVTGALTALTPNDATKGAAGSVTVQVEQTSGSPAAFSCVVPSDFPDLSAFLPVPASGAAPKLVEMKCELVDATTWQLRSLSAAGSSGSTSSGPESSQTSGKVESAKNGDETELKGYVTALTPASGDAAGSIVVDPDGSGPAEPVACSLPPGADTLGIAVGSYVELECKGGVARELELEDESDDDDRSGSSGESEHEEDDD